MYLDLFLCLSPCVRAACRRHQRVQGRNPPVSLQSDLREHQRELPLHLSARLQVSRSGTSLRRYVPSFVALITLPHHNGLNAFSHLGTKDFMFHFQMNSVEPLFTACEAVKRHFFVLLLSHASHQLVCLFCPAAFTLCVL